MSSFFSGRILTRYADHSNGHESSFVRIIVYYFLSWLSSHHRAIHTRIFGRNEIGKKENKHTSRMIFEHSAYRSQRAPQVSPEHIRTVLRAVGVRIRARPVYICYWPAQSALHEQIMHVSHSFL